MNQLIIGIGGVTNGGKTTLARRVHEHVRNSFIIAQDNYFKDDSVVAVDDNGFKQYDVIDALNMDSMMREIYNWKKDPKSYLISHGLKQSAHSKEANGVQNEVYVLITEGFLLYNYKPLNELFDLRYFLNIPYDVCKKRRCARVYIPPDPPGYFDGHVWPMYIKHRKEMEDTVSELVYLDGTKTIHELFSTVYENIMVQIQKRTGKDT
ncbi:nicotinamide riboside kinase 1 isoform X2 [Amia ocellicauda]|uniref:nicotinamide riboside kinase 1 isoform X2 n=1 Tax=Amia ocellicauda TaxID=2972642 RepID=UPI003463B934